jgi:cytochrome c oxidase cbb3-type subunit 4
MDITDVRAAMTVIMFVLFVGIVLWAFSKKRKRAFDEAARLPFDEDDAPRREDGKTSRASPDKKGA